MKEILDKCPECLKNYNKGIKMIIVKWTTNDLENNEKQCPYCGHKEIIEKGGKK